MQARPAISLLGCSAEGAQATTLSDEPVSPAISPANPSVCIWLSPNVTAKKCPHPQHV